jgi:MFS family permease
VFADRFNRKHLLIATDFVRAAAVLGFLLVRDAGDVWLLFVLTAVQVAMGGLFFPARNAMLPNIVSGRELGTANALSATTWSVMLSLGAALGGAVTGLWGVETAFVIDAGTYLLSAAALSTVTYRHEPTDGDFGPRSVLANYLAGLRYLANDRPMLSAALLKAGIALAVGAGIGPLLARRITGDDPRRLRIAISAAHLTIALGLVVMAPMASFCLFLLGTFLRGVGGGVNWVFSTQLLLQGAPDDVRGRVFSVDFAAFTLAQSISTAAGGWILDHTSITPAVLLWCLSGLILIPGALWTFQRHD